MKKAIFLDKDGTIIKNVPYNVDPKKVRLFKDAGFALQKLKNAGFLLIMVSNQAGVAKGYFSEKALVHMRNKLEELLSEFDVALDGFYYCPHHPEGTIKEYAIECLCRKPQAGMLLKAAEEHNIDSSASWTIGDILNDIEAGNTIGTRTILLDNGNETEWELNEKRRPDYIVKNLEEAVNRILFAEAAKIMGGIAYEG